MAHGGDASATGWFPVARAAEVGTTPIPVAAGGRPYVVVRLRPGGEVSAFPARCPHRLVPLAAGDRRRRPAAVPGPRVALRLRRPLLEIPSLGPDGTPPPRADLRVPWAVEERHGWVWIAPERTATPSPPRPAAARRSSPPASHRPQGAGLRQPRPVAGARLAPGGAVPRAADRRLAAGPAARPHLDAAPGGRRRAADPPAFGVRERLGVLWLAPAEPADVALEVPEADDRPSSAAGCRRCAPPAPPARWPTPSSTRRTARSCTPRPSRRCRRSPAYELIREPGGFRSVQEQEVDNPLDPGVATGERPLRQRRRTTYVLRAPFQLRLRQEFLDTGATTTLLYLLQPEDADSTRIYVCLMLAAGPGQRLPAPATVVEQVALQQQVLEEDVRSQAALQLPGLPLDLRDEVHVPADARASRCARRSATSHGRRPPERAAA